MTFGETWEPLGQSKTLVTTDRIRVPGGWLVRTVLFISISGGGSVHTVFIPERDEPMDHGMDR